MAGAVSFDEPREPAPMGADVEIVEPYSIHGGDPDTVPCIKPRRVRVNGVDVGLMSRADGIQVDIGDGDTEPVKVTLTLLAKTVTIKAE